MVDEAVLPQAGQAWNSKRKAFSAAFGSDDLDASCLLLAEIGLIDAMFEIGRRDEARENLVDALKLRNYYGLLSEDVHPLTGKLWGNFPQTYSMSGLILTAIKLSRSWGDRYWRGSSSSSIGTCSSSRWPWAMRGSGAGSFRDVRLVSALR